MKNFKYNVTVKMYGEDTKKVSEYRHDLSYDDITKEIKLIIDMYKSYIIDKCQCVKIKVSTKSGFILYNKRYVLHNNKLVEFSSKIRRTVESIKL